MKSVIVLWFFIVVIFIVLGLGFAYVIQQQQSAASGFKAVEQKVDQYDAVLKGLEAKISAEADSLKALQNALTSSEADKNGVNEKIESLMRQVEEVKTQLGDVVRMQAEVAAVPLATLPAAVAEPSLTEAPLEAGASVESVPAVELGTIPVEKESL